jgi:hypothetical protein
VPKSSFLIAESFARRLQAFDTTRIKIENHVVSKDLALIDAERMYEGLFLNIHTSFEQFLENLFLGLLASHNGHRSSRADIIPRIKVTTLKIAREIVFHGNKYNDWMPYEKTISLVLQRKVG